MEEYPPIGLPHSNRTIYQSAKIRPSNMYYGIDRSTLRSLGTGIGGPMMAIPVKHTPAVVPSILTAESLLQCAMLCLAVRCRRFAYERPRCGINIKSPDIGHSYWVDQKVKQVSVLKVTCL